MHLNHRQITYFIFGLALLLALIFDLGLLSKRGSVVTLRKALVQNFFLGNTCASHLEWLFMLKKAISRHLNI